jgi:archaemetzincin
MLLCLLPTEGVEPWEVAEAGTFAAATLGCAVRTLAPWTVPPEAYDPRRRQHDSSLVLAAALERCPPDAARLLVLTALDLAIPMLTFVFGQAQLDGRGAIVSLARLRPEFHGLPPAPAVTAARLRKEVLHELGHTCGLVHCPDQGCAMSLSVNIVFIDRKRAKLCRDCDARLAARLDTLRRETGAPEE